MTDQHRADPHAVIAAENYRKSRGLWRILAFIAIAAVVILALGRFALPQTPPQYVARIVIDGTIATDPSRLEVMRDLAEDDAFSPSTPPAARPRVVKSSMKPSHSCARPSRQSPSSRRSAPRLPI